MTTKNRLIIIDGNNYAWAAFHAYKQLTFRGNGVAMMYGLPQMLMGLIKEYPYQELIFVWDGLRSPYRMQLNPSYKDNRKHKSLVDMDDWMNQFKWTRRILHTMGITQICNGEADDMIFKLTVDLSLVGYKDIIIVSNDKDFHQMLSHDSISGLRIRQYNHKNKIMLETTNLNREYGYHPWQLIDFLTLTGDKGDNIDGYPGIGEVKAKEFLHIHGSITKFLEDKKAKYSIIDKDKLREIQRVAGGQINLTSFYLQIGKHMEAKNVFKVTPKIDHDRFLSVCRRFGLRKMMGNGFLAQFQRYKTTID